MNQPQNTAATHSLYDILWVLFCGHVLNLDAGTHRRKHVYRMFKEKQHVLHFSLESLRCLLYAVFKEVSFLQSILDERVYVHIPIGIS